jgi:hypothetical protein
LRAPGIREISAAAFESPPLLPSMLYLILPPSVAASLSLR